MKSDLLSILAAAALILAACEECDDCPTHDTAIDTFIDTGSDPGDEVDTLDDSLDDTPGDDTPGDDTPGDDTLDDDSIDDDLSDSLDDSLDVADSEDPAGCVDGSTRICGQDGGECRRGVQTCSRGQWGECEGAVEPTAERCDGLDNDCNGIIDDDLTTLLIPYIPLTAEWSSWMNVRNLTAQPGLLTATLYAPDGEVVDTINYLLWPNGNVVVDLSTGGPPDYVSVVVESSTCVIGQSSIVRRSDRSQTWSTDLPREGASQLHAPWFNNHQGTDPWRSRLVLMNPDDRQVAATVTYWPGEGGTRRAVVHQVPAHGSVAFWTDDDGTSEIPWGSITVNTQGGTVAGELQIIKQTQPLQALAHALTAESSTSLYAPRFTNRDGTEGLTWLVLANPNDQEASLTINFYGEDGVLARTITGEFLSAHHARALDPDTLGVPIEVGAIEVLSSEPLVGAAEQANSDSDTIHRAGTTLMWPSVSSSKLHAVWFNEDMGEGEQWDSQLCLFNPGEAQASITALYRSAEGREAATETRSLPPRGSTCILVSDLELGLRVGNVSVESTRPIIAETQTFLVNKSAFYNSLQVVP